MFPALDRRLIPLSHGRLKVALGQPILLLHTRGGTRMRLRARVVDGPERARLWERVNDNYNGYNAYQMRAVGRTIPVIVLEPAGDSPIFPA